jgi:UDP-N-acetylmuramoyl-tripeptide--D-alanyl-D-alanine ligase
LAAAAASLALDATLQQIASGLLLMKAVKGRTNVIQMSPQLRVIDDSYNASPASMRAAFAKLKALRDAGVAQGRLVAVLGDMLEMGEESAALHTALAQPLIDAGVDVIFAAGDMMKLLFNTLPASMQGAWKPTAAELGEIRFQPQDTVLFKG